MTDQERGAIQESIRAGAAPAIIKRRASRGTLPVSQDELLEILIFLTKDSDPTCSEVAKETLKSWTLEKCASILALPHISGETLAYFGGRDDLPEKLTNAILHHPNASDQTFAAFVRRMKVPQIYELIPDHDRALELPEFVKAALQRKDIPSDLQKLLEAALPREATPAGGAAQKDAHPERSRKSVNQQITEMGVSEKIAFATKANREAILILIRDPAKLVFRAALTSPKLGDAEAETISSMKNVSDEVLREMGMSRKFLKNKVVIRHLCSNPRTPQDITLGLMKHLMKTELKVLSANRNVAEVIRKTALKMFKMKST